MILTGEKIINEIRKGNITIKPFDALLINPNSYNFRLGDILYQLNNILLDPTQESKYKEIVLTDEGFTLQPNQLYLSNTFEEIGSKIYAMTLIGRSSIGRLGLFLQVSAPLGHVGSKHCWTLELKVVQPLKVYPKMKIGQISFWKVDGKWEGHYFSAYWDYSKPEISRLYKEVEDK